MATPQPAILGDLETHQWYVHMSRTEGADLGVIKSALAATRADAADVGDVDGLRPDLLTAVGVQTPVIGSSRPPLSR